jgi:hypothetical protein
VRGTQVSHNLLGTGEALEPHILPLGGRGFLTLLGVPVSPEFPKVSLVRGPGTLSPVTPQKQELGSQIYTHARSGSSV